MSYLKDYFEKIFVISLPHKVERREKLIRHLESTRLAAPEDLTWVRAIHGKRCQPPAYFHAGDGAWGCLQSHIRIVQDAIMDDLDNYLVLEDDVFFHQSAAETLPRFMDEVPNDWAQIYLGGEHKQDPSDVAGKPYVHRCHNVSRTHAFALRSKAFVSFQQHICHAPDYYERGGWHVDHQLGIAHERGDWKTYAPSWWIAGQEAGPSSISEYDNPRLWWHARQYSTELPYIYLPEDADDECMQHVKKYVHFGCNLNPDSCQDVGLAYYANNTRRLNEWLRLIAHEAVNMGMLPGIQHPSIPIERVQQAWDKEVLSAEDADLEAMVDYPFNGLFVHPLNR